MHYLSTNKTLIKKQSVKKMAKFKMLSFCQNKILWHQTSSCKCSMCLLCVCKVLYQMASVKALEVDFPMHALSECTHKPSRSKVSKKWLSSKHCQFDKKYFYGIKLLHVNVKCVYIVYAKNQMDSVKALVGVDFLPHVLSSTIQNYKGQ